MSRVNLRVCEILSQEDISAEQILKSSDVTQADLECWENDSVEITEEIIHKLNSLAQALDISVLHLTLGVLNL